MPCPSDKSRLSFKLRVEEKWKTWLITGTSHGFDREWTVAAPECSDRGVATAWKRRITQLDAEAEGDHVGARCDRPSVGL